MTKKETSSANDVARRIWLAGVGAYGKAFSDAQESLEKIGEDTSRRFEELVARGEEIEDNLEEKRQDLMERMPKQPFALDDRIQDMRQRLGLVIPANGNHDTAPTEFEDRLERLEDKVDLLLEQVQALSKSPVKKKTATRKRATKK
ncbi:MAG: phasin family protein [Aquisalinus sp.]|nr:phasin family protein [Aquisalinus sp.]